MFHSNSNFLTDHWNDPGKSKLRGGRGLKASHSYYTIGWECGMSNTMFQWGFPKKRKKRAKRCCYLSNSMNHQLPILTQATSEIQMVRGNASKKAIELLNNHFLSKAFFPQSLLYPFHHPNHISVTRCFFFSQVNPAKSQFESSQPESDRTGNPFFQHCL